MFRTWQTAVLAFGIVVMVTPFHVQGVEQPEPGGMSYGRGIFDKENFGLEVVWKKVLGPGNSRITVEAGRAATMFSDGQFDNLIALDMHTGKEIWRYRIAATYRGHDGSEDGPHA
ncbi:PQQ-like beta-propeller repeat protein, partial [candidate division KSB1 bacterium]|nr:PQQ-like beta-propeller repeat protein [candidate division KSB1 bacterium]